MKNASINYNELNHIDKLEVTILSEKIIQRSLKMQYRV